jgi:hypothetical protein
MATAKRSVDVWGGRTPFQRGGEWPTRVDTHLSVAGAEVERWVQSACVLCSNGCVSTSRSPAAGSSVYVAAPPTA